MVVCEGAFCNALSEVMRNISNKKKYRYGGLFVMNHETRLEDVKRFYEILEKLERRVGGRRILAECSRSLGLSYGGVYFFMEGGEERSESGGGLRVVRVGASSSLWNRLSAHKKWKLGIS